MPKKTYYLEKNSKKTVIDIQNEQSFQMRPNNAKSIKSGDSKHAPGSASARRSAKSKKSAKSRSKSEKSKDPAKDRKNKSDKGKIAGGFMRTVRLDVIKV